MLREVILALLYEYSRMFRAPLAGRKKLQKLVFLVDYDISGEKVRKLNYSGAKFKVLVYGPYSNEVAEEVEKLVEEGYIDEIVVSTGFSPSRMINKFFNELIADDGRTYVYKVKKDPKIYLDKKVRDRIRLVLKKYGKLTGGELEKKVIDKLSLTPDNKEKYFGEPIDKYLIEQRLLEH